MSTTKATTTTTGERAGTLARIPAARAVFAAAAASNVREAKASARRAAQQTRSRPSPGAEPSHARVPSD